MPDLFAVPCFIITNLRLYINKYKKRFKNRGLNLRILLSTSKHREYFPNKELFVAQRKAGSFFDFSRHNSNTVVCDEKW